MTAVEYLEKKLDDALCDTDYITWQLVCKAVKEAKEMEKQQIIDAYEEAYFDGYKDNGKDGQKYYNETFNK